MQPTSDGTSDGVAAQSLVVQQLTGAPATRRRTVPHHRASSSVPAVQSLGRPVGGSASLGPWLAASAALGTGAAAVALARGGVSLRKGPAPQPPRPSSLGPA
ncbi:MAG: hypothetical protein WCD35_10790 [Mycobacteriales bacterium]